MIDTINLNTGYTFMGILAAVFNYTLIDAYSDVSIEDEEIALMSAASLLHAKSRAYVHGACLISKFWALFFMLIAIMAPRVDSGE